MTPDDEAIAELWRRKAEGRELFAQAELVEDHEFKRWMGHGTVPEFQTYARKAGDTVLVTTASRFGHLCIRGEDIDAETHGYDSTIDPSKLRNVRFLSDGGRPWRKEMLQKMGARKEPVA